MKLLTTALAGLLVSACFTSVATAQAVDRPSRFTTGGGPEIDSPPLAKDDQEKQALAVLDEMSKGKW